MNIFTENEIYNLVLLEHGAQEVQRASGYPCHYSEDIDDSDIEDKIAILEDNDKLDKFDYLLSKAAQDCTPNFEELNNLKETDFTDETDETAERDFWDRREEIQGEITYKACKILIEFIIV